MRPGGQALSSSYLHPSNPAALAGGVALRTLATLSGHRGGIAGNLGRSATHRPKCSVLGAGAVGGSQSLVHHAWASCSWMSGVAILTGVLMATGDAAGDRTHLNSLPRLSWSQHHWCQRSRRNSLAAADASSYRVLANAQHECMSAAEQT